MKKVKKGSRRRIKNNEVLEVPVPPPEPTEQEKAVFSVINSSFIREDDVAKAAARFDAEVALPRYRENDASPEEFPKEEFQRLCEQLNSLALLKHLLPIFGLESYEDSIIKAAIPKVFDNKPSNQTGVFRGSDQAYLEHMTMIQK